MDYKEDAEIKAHSQSLINNRTILSQNPPQSFIASDELSPAEMEKLKDLQGECKIDSFQLLQLNYPKAIIASLLMTASIIGLLFIKHYKGLRAKLFYSPISFEKANNASHAYVKGTDKNQQICKLAKYHFEGKQRKVFIYKHLKYEYFKSGYYPLGFTYRDIIKKSGHLVSKGLQNSEVKKRQEFFGKNEHLVEVPNYFQYLLDVMTQPFFIFQYVTSIVYALEKVALFSVMMVLFGFLTTSINYVLLYFSYIKIKETAEKQYDVVVKRDGRMEVIKNVDLVCGDIYVPNGQVPCDSVLVAGDLFIDQSNLTGESVPIPKFKLTYPDEVQKTNHWLYEGSIVKTSNQNTLAMAVNIGFASQRGRIIRKILTKTIRMPQFFKKMIYFLIELQFAALLLYVIYFFMMLDRDFETILIVLRLFDLWTHSLPPALPIFFNLAYSFCIIRLRRQGIYGTECEKTIESSRMKTLYFDKTGTLTHSAMKVASVFAISEGRMADITEGIGKHPLIVDLFACCNSVEKISNIYEGDEIDLKMFHYARSHIEKADKQSPNALRCIKVQDRTHEILRINEYESRFQSMSVLFRHRETNRFFIAAKGNPEMIHGCSQGQIRDYDEFIKRLSLQGFRSIAFGWKEVPQAKVAELLRADRETFLKSIEIAGVVTFINLLKEDAHSTISTLSEADISTNIITGDNIFLGVQTAFTVGMIPPRTKVVVLEGAKLRGDSIKATEIKRLQNGTISEKERLIQRFVFQDEAETAYAVDNEFIKSFPSGFLHPRVRVFARVTPESKALIVRRHKEMITAKMKARSLRQRIFGESSLKVGMVGDGANDLIAIKEADVGIGISSTDAVYSASFAIKDLAQIIEIVLQAKNTERQIIDLTQYYMLINFLYLPTLLILLLDITTIAPMHEIYRNFLCILPITGVFGFSRHSKKLSKFLPNSNFMGVENQLIFWTNCAIASIAQYIVYLYYFKSSDFVPNPKPYATFVDGWNFICKSSSVFFLVNTVQATLMPFSTYRSLPWKEKIYKNILMTILIILNSIGISIIFFETQYLSFIQLEPIGHFQALIVLIIVLGGCLIAILANFMIEKAKLHQKQAVLESQKAEIREYAHPPK